MILQSLCTMAERENLLGNPDYEPKPVSWIISLDDNGKFLGAISTRTDDGTGKKPRAKVMSIPRRQVRGSKPAADFLVDKSAYVLGVLPDDQVGTASPERLEETQRLFSGEIEKASVATGEPPLNACLAFLRSEASRQACAAEMERVGYVSNDLMALEVDGTLVHEMPSQSIYFSGIRRSRDDGEKYATCLVCGEPCKPVRLHPSSFRMRGGRSSGIPLVTFDAPATESDGRSQGDNAPVCRGCSDAYEKALKRLLDPAYPDPTNPGGRLPKRHVVLSSDTTAVFWADDSSPLTDMLSGLFDDGDPEAINTLLTAPLRGVAPVPTKGKFYLLVITGTTGRAVIRSFHASALADIDGNVRSFFEVARSISEYPHSIKRLLRSLAPKTKQKDKDKIPASLASDLFMAILFGRAFPRMVLASACARCRAEQAVSTERAILLTTYFRSTNRKDVILALDIEQTDPGYRLGRLMAALEKLEKRARKNPDKTIVDRYYGAASTRPATIFPTILKLAVYNAAKLKAPAAHYHQNIQGEILSGLTGFPTTLTMEQQGLFALGYYHQRFSAGKQEPDSLQDEEEIDNIVAD